MNKVITINLKGRAYQVEELGYNALRNYLDTAAAQLADNPDKDEIIADFEQAIAEKCDLFLNSKKNVIALKEIEQIIQEMGPVENQNKTSSDNSQERSEKKNTGTTHRKLYLIREGAWISGVCNGLAAYFDIDVTIIRILFIVLTVLTRGGWILVYFVMMIVIPHATTPEQKAKAFGTGTMSAQDLIDRAKQGYTDFKNSDNIKQWKKQIREQARQWKYDQKYVYNRYGPPPFHWFFQLLGAIFWTAVVIFFIWLGYHHIGTVHLFITDIKIWIHRYL